MRIIDTLPEMADLLAGADHVDVRTAESEANLREFVAGALGGRAAGRKVLFRARAVLARLLRLRDPDIPLGGPLRPDELSFTPGDHISFFTVADAAEDRYVVLEAADNHLTGWLVITTVPANGNRARFEMATLVKYHRWTGPLYFNIIRPFHHLIIIKMARSGARASIGSREQSRRHDGG